MHKTLHIVLITLISSCNASESASSTIPLMGNLKLLNQPSVYESSYHLILKEPQHITVLFDNPVVELFGNDSVVVVKCINEKKAVHYFLVTHHKGNAPLRQSIIRCDVFQRFRDSANISFNFTDDVRYNWK